MNLRFFGGILMILGTSIGAGMLALPVATAHESYWLSIALLFAAWLIMTLGAFAILEVNLWLPQDSNLVSMARHTLGFGGQLTTWFIYLFLLYSLLCAYISGSSDILHASLLAINICIPEWLTTIITTVVLGYIVFRGIYSVDIVNRGLMSTKLIIFFILLAAIMPHINTRYLFTGNYNFKIATLMVMITSFGYAIIIPSLRSYFRSNVKKLRLVIIIGSCIPLIIYALWITAIQGLIPRLGVDGLLQIAKSGHTTSLLMSATSSRVNSALIGRLSDIFIAICAITSCIGVALCLTDFITDGLKLNKQISGKLLTSTLAFGPPLLIVLLAPGIFIKALSYAGAFCVVLLILLPLAMLYSGRHIKKISADYKFFVGRSGIIIGIAFAFVLLTLLFIF